MADELDAARRRWGSDMNVWHSRGSLFWKLYTFNLFHQNCPRPHRAVVSDEEGLRTPVAKIQRGTPSSLLRLSAYYARA
jgi:hypothetical protein